MVKKMWVTPVLEVERIRTGEINKSALVHAVSKNTNTTHDNYYDSIDTPTS